MGDMEIPEELIDRLLGEYQGPEQLTVWGALTRFHSVGFGFRRRVGRPPRPAGGAVLVLVRFATSCSDARRSSLRCARVQRNSKSLRSSYSATSSECCVASSRGRS
jgi:hypothetical protein